MITQRLEIRKALQKVNVSKGLTKRINSIYDECKYKHRSQKLKVLELL
jgi:hypothetical protein